MRPANLKIGFETTSIFTFDRNRFSKKDFIARSITDREFPMPDNNQSENQVVEIRDEVTTPREKQIQIVNEVFPTTSTSDKIVENHFISRHELKGYPKAAARKKLRTKGPSFQLILPKKIYWKEKIG